MTTSSGNFLQSCPGRSILGLVLVLTIPALVRGQEPPPVPMGSEVRVWAPEMGFERETGRILAWRESTLWFQPAGAPGDTLRFPFGGVTRIDWHRGNRSAGMGALKGAAIGGGVGMLLGMVIGQAAVSGCQEFLCGLDALNYWGAGWLIGAALGAGVGSANPPERWDRVQLPLEAGFPPRHTPWHQTWAFRLGSLAVSMLALAAIQ